MSDIKVGQLAIKNKRDAIHVAVIGITASQRLTPGSPVGRNCDGQAVAVARNSPSVLGIVDPYLTSPIEKGEVFWLFLLPGTVTGMSHHWEHPAFQTNTISEQSKINSEAWLRKYSEEQIGYYLPNLITAIGEGSLCFGEDDYHHKLVDKGDGEYDLPDEFWEHYTNYTGKAKPGKNLYFSCAC